MNPADFSVFVSYSHKDESYKDELEKHLTFLKQTEAIGSFWSDRKLICGDAVSDEIRKNLHDADIVIFLVSIDFLTSWFCVEVELTETLQRLKSENIRVITVPVRQCSWKQTKLAKYLTATVDGKPIASYADQDEAWNEVSEQIAKSAEKLANHGNPAGSVSAAKTSFEKTSDTRNQKPPFEIEFRDWLADTAVPLQHDVKEDVCLEDIFIFPDFKNINSASGQYDHRLNSRNTISEFSKFDRLLIIGTEQSGKTTLAKILATIAHDASEWLPIYLDAARIRNVECVKLVGELLKEQYGQYEEDCAKKYKKLLILDDFDLVKINERYLRKLLSGLEQSFDCLCVFAASELQYDELKYDVFSGYEQYELLNLNHERRGELIDKWNSLGQEQVIQQGERHAQNDRVTRYVDGVILRNVLPSKPFYVLSVVQMCRVANAPGHRLTSYGHCYQSLIQVAFARANIGALEFDTLLNYLTELAYFIYSSEDAGISELDQFDLFKKNYSEKYIVQSHDRVINKLVRSGLLVDAEPPIKFRYKYIYYFYVAKYLSDNLNVVEFREVVAGLCAAIHLEESANILIFVIHHTKNPDIVNQILQFSDTIFQCNAPATLNKHDTSYISSIITEIPNLVIEQRNVESERKKQLQLKDAYEDNEDELVGSVGREGELDTVGRDRLRDINRSFRTIQVVGQILRNRQGSLEKTQLRNLSISACGVGFRFLRFVLEFSEQNENIVTDAIVTSLREPSELNDQEIADGARKALLMLCYGTAYAVIRNLAESLGSRQLLQIFTDLRSANWAIPSFHLLYIAMELEFNKRIPRRECSKTLKAIKGNDVAFRLLQEVVAQHSRLNYVEYTDQQWVSRAC